MIEAIIHTNCAMLKAVGSVGEAKASAIVIRNVIDPVDRTYEPPNTWKIKNPWKYAGNIPALNSALEDAQRQETYLSAKDIARVQDQKYAVFFYHLTNHEQLVILECALQGLRDELQDGILRESGLLGLDLSDDVIEPIKEKLDKFMED